MPPTLETETSPEYRNVSVRQIVPRLADGGVDVASESSFYRSMPRMREEWFERSSALASGLDEHHEVTEMLGKVPRDASARGHLP